MEACISVEELSEQRTIFLFVYNAELISDARHSRHVVCVGQCSSSTATAWPVRVRMCVRMASLLFFTLLLQLIVGHVVLVIVIC